jgi:hypothetical protein
MVVTSLEIKKKILIGIIISFSKLILSDFLQYLQQKPHNYHSKYENLEVFAVVWIRY